MVNVKNYYFACITDISHTKANEYIWFAKSNAIPAYHGNASKFCKTANPAFSQFKGSSFD